MMNEPINPYASPEAEIIPEPVPEEGRLSLPGMRTTGIGLSLIYYGILLTLFAIVAMFISTFLIGASIRGPGERPPTTYLIILMCGGIAIIVGELVRITGLVLCMFVPTQSQAKIYILIAAVLQLLAVGINIGSTFFSMFQDLSTRLVPVRERNPLSLVAALCGIVGFILFLLFMRKLAQFIDRWDLSVRVRNVFICVAVLFVMFLAMIAGAIAQIEAIFALGFVVLIAGLVFLVMFLNLVNALRLALFGKNPSSAPKSFLLSRHD